MSAVRLSILALPVLVVLSLVVSVPASTGASGTLTLLEDFQDDSDPTQAGFSSNPVFQHSPAAQEAFVTGDTFRTGDAYPSPPHGLAILGRPPAHTITFPGATVTRAVAHMNRSNGFGLLTFVGQGDSIAYRHSAAIRSPWLRFEVDTATIGANGLPLGNITAIVLDGGEVVYDDIEVDITTTGPACDFSIPTPTPPLRRGGPVIFGTAGDDVIVGTPGSDVIFGMAGNDCVDGRGGTDVIMGDGLVSGEGDDVLLGGPGNDLILGGPGDDTIDGGDQDDRIFAMGGDDTIDGGAGNDRIDGGPGNDTCVGETLVACP